MILDRETRTRSLEALGEQVPDHPQPGTHLSRVNTECPRLCRLPLDDLGPDDLRMLIGQEIGWKYLIPLTLERLLVSPWIRTGRYGRHLIEELLEQVSAAYWREHPALAAALDRVVARALEEYRQARGERRDDYDAHVLGLLRRR